MEASSQPDAAATDAARNTWAQLALAVRAAQARHGERAWQPGLDGGVEDVRCAWRLGGAPAALPTAEESARELAPAAQGVVVVEAAALFPDEWDAWGRARLASGPVVPEFEIGVMWAAMVQESGPVSLPRMRQVLPRFRFLQVGHLGPCGREWVRELARAILAAPPLESSAREWTRRSLAALALADRYEDLAEVRAALAPALLQGAPLDLQAHPGALIGLCVYGDERAAQVFRALLALPGWSGHALLLAWCAQGSLADEGLFECSEVLRAVPRGRGVPTTAISVAALQAWLESGRDPALLNLLVARALDPAGGSIDARIMLQKLVVEGADVEAGAWLAIEFASQDPRQAGWLVAAAVALRERHADPTVRRAWAARFAALRTADATPRRLAELDQVAELLPD